VQDNIEGEGNFYSAPRFSETLDNFYMISEESMCVNAGIQDTTGLNLRNFDIRGEPRIFNGSINRVDIGAYEVQSDPIVIEPYDCSLTGVIAFPPFPMELKLEVNTTLNGNVYNFTS